MKKLLSFAILSSALLSTITSPSAEPFSSEQLNQIIYKGGYPYTNGTKMKGIIGAPVLDDKEWTFDNNNQFERGEVVIVPRSSGKRTYAIVLNQNDKVVSVQVEENGTLKDFPLAARKHIGKMKSKTVVSDAARGTLIVENHSVNPIMAATVTDNPLNAIKYSGIKTESNATLDYFPGKNTLAIMSYEPEAYAKVKIPAGAAVARINTIANDGIVFLTQSGDKIASEQQQTKDKVEDKPVVAEMSTSEKVNAELQKAYHNFISQADKSKFLEILESMNILAHNMQSEASASKALGESHPTTQAKAKDNQAKFLAIMEDLKAITNFEFALVISNLLKNGILLDSFTQYVKNDIAKKAGQ